MALDFAGLQTEVFARGFDYLNDAAGLTRVKRWINDAAHEVDSLEKWDYTYATAAGVMPLTIADLRLIEDVALTTSLAPLPGQSRNMLEAVYGILTTNTASTPLYWYKSAPTIVTAYPLNTSLSLTARYWKFAPDLVNNIDTPLMPDRFRQVIVEVACAKGFRDSNDVNAANDCLAETGRLLDKMRAELLPDFVVAQPPLASVGSK